MKTLIRRRHQRHTVSDRRFLGLLLLLAVSSSPLFALQQTSSQRRKLQREESMEHYYQKWLKEDVVWIILPEEKEVFEALKTDEERDQFIEQFWRTRDPDPRTIENEFKAEHYRRIAYANERYFAGVPGWKSDRGQIYIRFGKPDQTEKYPAGGPYRRTAAEGGGDANTFPFERWWYAYLEDVGENVEIEFVDRNGTNEYRIALNANDKESFIHVGGSSQTQDEFDGIQTRADRLYHNPLGVNRDNINVLAQDLPFQRLRRFALIQKAPKVEHTHLQELVDTSVRYDSLPFSYRADWIRIGEQALVPITIGVKEQDLQFGADGMGPQAGLNVFGRVKGLNGEIVSIFEHTIVKDRAGGVQISQSQALYQKVLVLDPGRYRLDLVVEDIHSGKLGLLQQALHIPRMEQEKLTSSPVILVDRAHPVDSSDAPEMFVLGGQKIYPRLGDEIPASRYVMFYVELYNVGVDAASLAPDLSLTYQLIENGVVVDEKVDAGGRRATFASNQRIVLLEYLNLSKARSDAAVIRIIADDRVTGQKLTIDQPVKIARARLE